MSLMKGTVCVGVCVCVCSCSHLLPDEQAGDEEAIQAQEAIQDVAQLGVVHFHCLCIEERRVSSQR